MPAPSSHSRKKPRPPRVGVLGATLGTGNLGVDALGMAMVQGLVGAIPNIEIVYQAWDLRQKVVIPFGEKTLECEPLAIRRKGSLRHRDGLMQIQKMARMRRWLSERSVPKLPSFSSTLKQLLSCDAILDVSAGDSFASIYGEEVFWYQTQIKLLCLELGLPFILMPQTYGPFDDEASEEIAGDILSRATMVCSRESSGLEEVKQLCGSRLPGRLVRVPDMAFLLEPRETALPPRFQQAKDNGSPCIALNISGLLFFAQRSFGLQVDYPRLARQILDWALSIPESHVLLVPHVVSAVRFPGTKGARVPSTDTTDTKACEKLFAELDKSVAPRVDVLPEPKDPAQAKFAMSLCDFFVGARMHAFIGAISQCVPGTLLAYSKKADGLACLLGIGDAVVDMRSLSEQQCVTEIDAQYHRRRATQEHLANRVPLAKAELHRFFSEEIAPLVLNKNPTLAASVFLENATKTSIDPKRVLS